jgi:hypothetical protein
VPPKYLKRPAPTRLRPCAEHMVEVCDNETHGGCCKVPPCKLCLELEIGYNIATGSANDISTGWSGAVGGYSFLSYWERNYDGVCEYVVEFDGLEVYRETCYGGASCRNPAGSVEVAVGYDTGILRWEKFDPRELQLIDHPDTGCRPYFCDDCRCTCECLCWTLKDGYGAVIDRGELCNTAYPCNPPVWEGVIDYKEVSLALGRDEYGHCIITATVDGYELGSVLAPGCSSMTAVVVLEDGSSLEVSCKQCGCEEVVLGCCQCVMTRSNPELQPTLRGTTPGGDACDGYGGTSVTGATAHPVGVPDGILKPWNPSVDCLQRWEPKWKNYPSGTCVLAETGFMVVMVRHGYGDLHEAVESHVEPCDWYLVVYEVDDLTDESTGEVTAFLGIFYEFAACCEAIPNIGDLRALKYVSFSNVTTPHGVYDFLMRDEQNILDYGEDCGSS